MIKIKENKITINNVIIGEPIIIFTNAYTSLYNNNFIKITYIFILEKDYIKYKKFVKEKELRNKILNEQNNYKQLYFNEDIVIKKDFIIKDISDNNTYKDILLKWQTQNQEVINKLIENYNLTENDYIIIDDYSTDYTDIENKINSLLEQRQYEEKLLEQNNIIPETPVEDEK